jgi:amidase/aspartyl-tRNA(Asn)/glutamyl-tRNA(Gln) amidotransferase subunit A
MLVHEILAQRRVVRSPAPLSAYRLGVANAVMLDGLDATVAEAWHRSLTILRLAGARIDEIPLSEINELQQIQASGGFSAAESYAWHHQLMANKKESYDPRVAVRIERGASMSARDYIELLLERRNWIDRMTHRLQGFDAVLSPTVAVVAPPISDMAPGAQRDDVFFRTNALLLRNTSVVNMLDGCAISIPCHASNELPVGLMVWAGALQDDPVLNIAFEIENLLRQP